MATDDLVIVVGDDTESGPPVAPPSGPRSHVRALLPAVALLVAVVVFVTMQHEEGETTTDPGGLEAPEEPESVAVTETTRVSESNGTGGLGVRRVDISGPGYVSSVEHGPDGWLAVSGGALPVVVHTSEDAVLWRPSTVRGMVGDEPVAAVGEGMLAVFGSNLAYPDQARSVGAISIDGGASWSLVEHGGLIAVDDVAILGGRVYVAGAVGAEPGFEWEQRGSAALWEVVDGRLRPVEVDNADVPSEIRSIVPTPLGPMAFGTVGGHGARWNLRGERQHLILPTDGADTRFVTVDAVGEGLVALVGRSGVEGGTALWESVDGFEWTDRSDLVPMARLGDMSVLDLEEVVGVFTNGERVWFGEEGVVDAERLFGDPGREPWFTSVGAADGVTVFGGSDAGSGALFVHGSIAQPVEVLPTVPADQPSWEAQLTVDLDTRGLGGPAWPLGSMATEDAAFFVSTSHVFEVESNGGLFVSPVIEYPSMFGTWSSGAWVATNDGPANAVVHLRDAEGRWTDQPTPLSDVLGVGTVEGALAVTGWGNRGPAAHRLDADGTWTLLTEPAGVRSLLFPAGDGLVAAETTEFGSFDGVSFSRNGTDWEPVEGWTLHWQSGGPFLRAMDDASVVAFLDGAPDPQPIQLPTDSSALQVWPWRAGVVAQDPWTLHISSGPDEWLSLPIDVEHGVTGAAVALPGDEPRLAMIDNGLLTFLVWR